MGADRKTMNEVTWDMPEAWRELIEALVMLGEKATTQRPFNCSHDTLTVCGVETTEFTIEELAHLDELGFYVGSSDDDDTDGSFYSYKYGSA